MWPDRLLESRITEAVRLTARFAEERQRVLATNVANIDTPDYRQQRLDADAFQRSLREAFETAERQGVKRLALRGNAQFTSEGGALSVKPAVEPPPNLLFHDGGNRSLEQLMGDVQQNALTHRASVNLLRGRFNSLMNAIRGRIQ